jgi:hypothetical protein
MPEEPNLIFRLDQLATQRKQNTWGVRDQAAMLVVGYWAEIVGLRYEVRQDDGINIKSRSGY